MPSTPAPRTDAAARVRPVWHPDQVPWLRAVDHFAGFAPEGDARRRARLVVLASWLYLPFYAILIQQQIAGGLYLSVVLSAGLTGCALAVPWLLRWSRQITLSALVVCLNLLAVLLATALSDAGLDDPVLFWMPLVPLVAAVLGGWRLSALLAALTIGAGVVLYALELSGHPFPRTTGPEAMRWFQALSVVAAVVFSFLVGALYEGYTVRRLREQRAQLHALSRELERSEHEYRSLFEHAPIGLYRTGLDGEVLMVNAALLALLRCRDLGTLRRAGALSVYEDPSDRDRLMARLRAEGAVSGFESVWVTHDGRRCHVRENARLVPGADGQPPYVEGSIEDVSGAHEAVEALRRSEERFRSLVQHARDLVTVLDAAGTITYQSPAVEYVLGYAAEDTVGRPLLEFVHPEDASTLVELLEHGPAPGEGIATVEMRVRHAEGPYVWLEAVGSNRLGDESVRGIVLNTRDITERKRAAEALREAALRAEDARARSEEAREAAEEHARLKSAFLANMSHEIRTPLTGILGFADLLAEDASEEQAEFVGLIARSGRRLLATLNSVLDLARLEARAEPLDLIPTDLAGVIAESVALLRPLAAERGLALEIHTEGDGRAAIDPAAFGRVLDNLLGNAIKFTDRGGVAVHLDTDPDTVYVRVRDTGRGMDPEFLDVLFEAFRQESSGMGRTHEGSGLGLTLTQRLVEGMGGTITAESVKGEGSTFTIALPRLVAIAAPEPASGDRADVPEEPGPRHRVLLLEDNDQTRWLATRQLAPDYDVVATATAHDAIEAARQQRPDLLLLDIHLGEDRTGQDVLRAIRALPACADVPAVAFTAFALPGDRERFRSDGFDGYLSKPFSRPRLLAALDAALAVAAE